MTHKQRLHVHTSRQQIRWGDMDLYGHVNNTVYFRYMEQARLEWRYEMDRRYGPQPDTARVLANASCTFILPLVFPGEIEVRVFLAEPGRTSVNSYYEIWCEGRMCAEGASRIVWIDRKSGRPVPLPEFLTSMLGTLGISDPRPG